MSQECEIVSGDFSTGTVTVRMLDDDYRISAGKYLLLPVPVKHPLDQRHEDAVPSEIVRRAAEIIRQYAKELLAGMAVDADPKTMDLDSRLAYEEELAIANALERARNAPAAI